ncbi:MAG: heparinase II/III domain-containing protein [Candidatus Latescibacterota bacterium]
MPIGYRTFAVVIALLALITTTVFPQIPPRNAPEELKRIIRKDHPRLFFNKDTFPKIKARALGEERADFDRIKARMDKLLTADSLASNDYGSPASEAAFVWLVTEDDRYLALAKRLLETSIRYYHECYTQQKPVNWYAFTQINAWSAYDWIFNRLTPEERTKWGASFIEEVELIQPTDKRHYFYPQENWSGITTGFYGNRSLLWFAGLATFGENVDSRSETFLAEGYKLYMEVIAHRRKGAGDDGGSASACMNYVMAAYPWSVFNFFHTHRSATGRNIALDWPDVSYLPGYLYWNLLPGRREFGVGDAPHSTNLISLGEMRTHILQIINFFGATEPQGAGFAKWMLSQVPQGGYGSFPWLPFLLTERRDDLEPLPPAKVMPYARHFENMGQVFMRSGSGPDDTYALFMCGGVLEQHKHWDNNHFAIFKKGFLALDTGSRPAPGQHTQHYFPRTIAHNCILINMPGEQLPIFVDKGAGGGQRWGAPAPEETEVPIPNDGGQKELMGSDVIAFETGNDFSYVAGDATRAYAPEKCRLALRQFVFLNPDYFVIFDRVTSTKPEYKKTWLLHTATEPQLDGSVFTAVQGGGRLYSRTLLPEQYEMVKIGGPGRQFMVGNQNFPLPKGYAIPDTTQILGQWRVEVSPRQAGASDYFLHFIQAGDSGLPQMAKSELVRKGKRSGVRFTDKGRTWELLFDTEGPAGGRITIKEGARTILDRDLDRKVQPQKGLFGTE